jgi:hypothetical protein
MDGGLYCRLFNSRALSRLFYPVQQLQSTTRKL